MSKVKTMIEDSLVSGPDNAIWWTEYVIKNKGAKHLQTPFHTFVEYYMLELAGYVLTVIIVLFFLVFKITRKLWTNLKTRFTSQKKQPPGGKFKAL